MSWTRKNANVILFISSCLVGLIIVEIGYSFLNQNLIQAPDGVRRFMTFKGGNQSPVFKNLNNFFVYEPNQKIESTTFYYVNGEWIKEYDYITPTNNLGLVQTTPTLQNKNSLLILGDSFTEGAGAYPWFEKFRETLRDSGLQAINGGILGTGFQSWKLLHDHLINDGIAVKKIIVIFISDDYSRSVWNMPNATLDCISNPSLCKGDENFYGKPDNKELENYLERLRAFSENSDLPTNKESIKRYLRRLLPGTSTAYSFLKVQLSNNENSGVIESLVTAYGSNILFVHIPQKEEVMSGEMNFIGKKVVNVIQSFNGKIFDGHKECGFESSDYFINDGHPNAKGYEKLSKCVRTAIELEWGF